MRSALPENALIKFKIRLNNQYRQITREIDELSNSDPIIALSYEPVPEESGTAVWQANVHTKYEAIKKNLLLLSNQIEKALSKIKSGKYGICEKCLVNIEQARLEVLPAADRCSKCAELFPNYYRILV